MNQSMPKKVTEIEEQYPSYTVTLKEEWVCDICGTRTEAVTEQNEARFAAHFTGKVHQGYAKIRDWVKVLLGGGRGGEMRRGGPSEASEKSAGLLRSFPCLRNRPREPLRSPPGF